MVGRLCCYWGSFCFNPCSAVTGAVSVLTPAEKVVIVEEQEILLLHFVNYTEQHQFVYLYYLEETG